MAEVIRIVKDSGSGLEFADAVRDTPPEGGDLAITVKNKGTEQGNPVAALTFTVQLPSGEILKVSTVNTVYNLLMALAALDGIYPGLGAKRSYPPPEAKAGDTLSGEHRGIKWEAKLFERLYVVALKGVQGGNVSLAGGEKEAKGLGEMMVNQWFEGLNPR